MISELLQHPLSAAFPSMPDADLAALADDVAKQGQREKGVVYEGMVLDGWHRYLACKRAGLTFKFKEFEGDDPIAFVLSKNLHRRHLNASQRAAAIVAATNWRAAGKSKPEPSSGLTEKQMAETAEVSDRTIRHAKVAHEAGLGDRVLSGEVSAKRAAEVAHLPPKKRERALQQPKPKEPSPEEATIKALQAQIEELKESLGDATVMAEAAKIHEGEEGFRNIKAVLAELESVKRRRDQLMNENAELRRQIKFLERDLKAARK